MAIPEPTSEDYISKVKICGLRTTDDAVAAANAGADILGFNFVEGVRRQLMLEQAKRIIDGYHAARAGSPPGDPRLAGLFRNQPLRWVRSVAEECGLHLAQLCGDEDLAYAEELVVPVLRQIRVHPGESRGAIEARAREWLNQGHMVLLDAYDPDTPGGAGVTFDWSAAEGVASLPNVLLAGGLTPDNVSRAIERLRPWGVDVASGIETDGDQNAQKIRVFVRKAKSA